MWRHKVQAFVGAFGLALLSACGPASRAAAPAGPGAAVPPPDVNRVLAGVPAEAREAYAFALARPDVLRYVPCYCGCGGLGHSSNLSCFVRSASAAGGVVLDSHGAT